MTGTTNTNPPAGPDEPDPSPDDTALLKAAAGRAGGRPECLAWVLARFQEDERMGDRALAKRLGVGPDGLLRLRLCLRPREGHFARDVEEIANASGVDADALFDVLHAADVAERMRATAGGHAAAANVPSPGHLLAARERRVKKRPKGKPKDKG